MRSQLDMINAMLEATGVTALSAEDTDHPYYEKALMSLRTSNAELQGRGWWFNTYTHTVEPNTSGELILPQSTLSADPVDSEETLTMRSGRLFDRIRRTYEINRPISVHFVEEVAFTDLPQTFFSYLSAYAVYRYALSAGISTEKRREYREILQEAKEFAFKEDLRHRDINSVPSKQTEIFGRWT